MYCIFQIVRNVEESEQLQSEKNTEFIDIFKIHFHISMKENDFLKYIIIITNDN